MTGVDLLSFINQEQSPQPETLTLAYGQLLAALRETDSTARELVLKQHMADISRWIATGVLNGLNAASALFVGHSLLADYQAGSSRTLGFVHQLSMSPAQWVQVLNTLASGADKGREEQSEVLRLDQFPATLLNFLFNRGERDILREIFRGARQALDAAARRAMSDAGDFDSWVADLGVMAAYLTLRWWLPLEIPLDGGSERPEGRIELFKAEDGGLTGGRFVPPPAEENPLLAHLFQRDEIEALRRKEAYAAECFAHLYTSVTSGHISPQYQQKMTNEYAQRAATSRLDARQWLALGKSRFEIAPYIS